MVVVGPSGSGKSSLLRAGLLTALGRGEVNVPGSAEWPWLLLTPGEHPLLELASRLAAKDGIIPEIVYKPLQAHPGGFSEFARRLCVSSRDDDASLPGGSNHRLVVVVDQCEEVFAPSIDEVERSAFIAALTGGADAADPSLRLWSLADSNIPRLLGAPLLGHTGPVYGLAFSSDGRTLASSGADRSIRLWDVSTPTRPVSLGEPLMGPNGTVFSLAFSSDGRMLAVGSADHTVQLYNVMNLRQPVPLDPPLTGPGGDVQSVAFNPNGSVQATGFSPNRSKQHYLLADLQSRLPYAHSRWR